jgi:hypothetical protein
MVINDIYIYTSLEEGISVQQRRDEETFRVDCAEEEV